MYNHPLTFRDACINAQQAFQKEESQRRVYVVSPSYQQALEAARYLRDEQYKRQLAEAHQRDLKHGFAGPSNPRRRGM